MNKNDTQALVQKFLEEGGEIQKLPYRAPHYQKKDCDRNRTPKPSTFSPKEEAARLARKAEERAKQLDEYRVAKMTGKLPVDATPPPWEE